MLLTSVFTFGRYRVYIFSYQATKYCYLRN